MKKIIGLGGLILMAMVENNAMAASNVFVDVRALKNALENNPVPNMDKDALVSWIVNEHSAKSGVWLNSVFGGCLHSLPAEQENKFADCTRFLEDVVRYHNELVDAKQSDFGNVSALSPQQYEELKQTSAHVIPKTYDYISEESNKYQSYLVGVEEWNKAIQAIWDYTGELSDLPMTYTDGMIIEAYNTLAEKRYAALEEELDVFEAMAAKTVNNPTTDYVGQSIAQMSVPENQAIKIATELLQLDLGTSRVADFSGWDIAMECKVEETDTVVCRAAKNVVVNYKFGHIE